MRLLLVEDDLMIGEAIRDALREASYAVDWVRDGAAAAVSAGSERYDLLLLDIGLPDRDGFAVLQALRSRQNRVPVVIITARDGVDDRVRGLDGGADDYVVKPFIMAELLARMRAVLRRSEGNASPVLTNGVVALDPTTREATAVGTGPILLSKREFALLHALMTRPGAILSRAELEHRIYGWGEEVESNAVEFLIHSLRKKLGSEVIKNVRGLGWRVDKG